MTCILNHTNQINPINHACPDFSGVQTKEYDIVKAQSDEIKIESKNVEGTYSNTRF